MYTKTKGKEILRIGRVSFGRRFAATCVQTVHMILAYMSGRGEGGCERWTYEKKVEGLRRGL